MTDADPKPNPTTETTWDNEGLNLVAASIAKVIGPAFKDGDIRTVRIDEGVELVMPEPKNSAA